LRILIALIPLLLAAAAPARAVVHIWNFDIGEDQVKNSIANPPGDGSTDSLATGRGHLRYDSDADTLFYSISWDRLEGDLTALHIHGPADATMSTPNHLVEIFNTSQDALDAGLDLRSDVTEGTIEGFGDGMECDAGGALACFLEERAYVNVHSQAFTMGEIRGNLLLRPSYVFFDAVSTEDQVNNAGTPDGSTDSPGIGYGHFRYDAGTEIIDYTITWSGLQGNLIKLHVHGPADPGSSNPNHLLEIFNSADDVTMAGVDPRGGSYTGQVDVSGDGTVCDDVSLLPCLEEGRAYINVHTEAFLMGEIRGDLRPRPGVLRWSFLSSEDQVKNHVGAPGDGSTDSPATGTNQLRYDAEREVLAYTISWNGLLENLIKLHIHGAADADESNPNHLLEIFNSADDVADAGADPVDDSHAGTFSIDGTNLDCLTDDPLVCLIEERGYVNVHSEAFPMGEIRGNALLVPEPSASLLGAVALVACGLLRRAGRGVAPRRRSAPR
jgi:hypothetical protein